MRRGIKFRSLTGDTLHEVHERNLRPVDAIPTPFPHWNDVCGGSGGDEGLARGWVVVVGGSDGVGKSYLSVNMAAHAVLDGRKVGLANFEMDLDAVVARYLGIISGIPSWKIRRGKHYQQDRFKEAAAIVDEVYERTGGELISSETSVFTIDDLVESYDKLKHHGCDIIIVDYAQLVTVPGTDGIHQRSEIVSNRLRELTHEWEVTSLILSQLNREGKKVHEQRPSRHFLMGGSGWENNADMIALIDHSYMINAGNSRYTRLIIDKNRHGPAPLDIPIEINLDNMRWQEGAPELPDDVIVEAGEVVTDEEDELFVGGF